jgi:purine-nucleoside phosphorylase
MASKHINAASGDFGDPLRAQYIADTYLENAKRVNDVRNMWGFTGEYKGIPVSVQAHGMGIPSASIYCTELITEYDVKRMIRVGSCGTTHSKVSLRDIIIAMGASTDSIVNRIRFSGYDLAAKQGQVSRRQHIFRRSFLLAGCRVLQNARKVRRAGRRDGSSRHVHDRCRTWRRGARDLHGQR